MILFKKKKAFTLKKLDKVGYFPSFFFFLNIYLLLWLCWVFVVADGLSCPTACGILVP